MQARTGHLAVSARLATLSDTRLRPIWGWRRRECWNNSTLPEPVRLSSVLTKCKEGTDVMSRRVSMSAALIAACVSIAVWSPSAALARARGEAPAGRFVPGEGEPQTWSPIAQDDPAIAAMSVVRFDELYQSNFAAVRLFGLASGDPAMNGLMVYLAFVSPHDQSAFLLGDFRDYRVIAASPGRIDLEYDEDIMIGDEPQTRTLRAIVSWTEQAQDATPNPEYPAEVTLTPAQ